MPLTPEALLYLYCDNKETILKEKYERRLMLILYNNKDINTSDIIDLYKYKTQIECIQKFYKEYGELLK